MEGVAKTGNVLTAKHNLRDKDNITAQNTNGAVTQIDAYQWLLDGLPIDGAHSQPLVLTSDMETKRVSVSVTYTDSLNAEHTVTSNRRKVNSSPTGTVSIVGTPRVNKQLTINTSNLKDLNQFNQLFYQWFSVDNGVETEIANASLQQFTVRLTDIGKSLRANVYYTDNDGFQETVSTDTVAILDSVATGVPSIDGVVLAGNTVTANIANINDDNGIQGYQYQWRVDSQNVDGATFNTFTISPDENGNYGDFLDLVVTVTDMADNTYVLYSEPVRIALAAGTVGEDGGTVSGENVSLTIQAGSLSEDTVIYVYETQTDDDAELPEGSTLVGTAWAFTPHGTTFSEPVSIQFEVPEGTNLVLRADNEEDNTFEIVESYNVDSTTATIQTNTFSVYVGSVFTPAVITGTPEQGSYLTASVSGDVGDISFQWLRNGDNILNAQDSIYLVKLEDVGENLSVAATFTDANGVSATKVSSELEILNTPAQGQIKINGSRRVGVTLESEIVSITDTNTASQNYSYQWFRNDLQIDGATSPNYEVVQDDFMKRLFVRVSFTDAAQNIESVDSEEVFITKEGSIFFNSASRRQGDTLTINVSTLNDFYRITNTNYTWYLDDEAVANGSKLKERQLTTQDSGKNLKAVLTYTDGRGTVETLETDERFIYTISGTITPAGGIIADNGISINVPAGAVSENVDILVYVVPYAETQLPIGTLSDELAYAFTPLELAFDQPITITLPKPNDEYDMILYGANNSVDEFLMTEDDFLTINNTNQITIQTDNFGVFASAILYVRVDILGTPEQGQILDTLFTGEVHSYTYQWYRGETPIAGETGSTYTVVLEDVGEEIKIIATYLLEEDSTPETVESEPVLIVNSQPEVDTSAIVSGEDRVGEILTADPSGITDDNNPDGLSDFLYQWKVEGQDIDGATSETMTIQPEHFNKNITVEITYVDATGLLESVTSDNLYITRIPPTGYVEVIGTPEVGEYLEVDTDNLVDLNGIGEFSYQWHADGVDLTGEISASLLVTSDMEDKAISATLTYTDGVGEVETVTTRNAPVIDADPVGNVVIDYTILEVAQTLVANTNAISDANSPGGVTGYTYQWKSNGSPISGATSKNYVVANQFCNTDITVTVTYTDGDGYIETLTSDAVTIVNSPVQGRPTVSGTPGVSETLTINTDGLISDVNVIGVLNYKWFADGLEISGATEKTWVVAANSYVGKNITGQVYYTDEAGNAEEVTTSNGLVIENSPPVNKPIIHGTLQVGQTLTVDPSEIEDFNIINSDFSYQWYANNVAITDETGSSYVVQVDDINKNISVDASYTDEGNTFETVRSDNYVIVNTPGTATVLITNTGLEQGDILSSSVTSQDDNIRVSDYSYQWKRDGVAIRNAYESTYMFGRNDLNKEITLQASFTDTGGFVETFQSENSASMIVASPTGEIHILGSDKVGENVEADVSEIQDMSGIRPEREVLNYGIYLKSTRTHSFTEGMVTKIVINPVTNVWGKLQDMQLYASSSSGWGWVNVNNLQHNLNRTITTANPLGYYAVLELNHPIRARQIHYRQYGWLRVHVFTESTKAQEAYTYQWYRDGDMITGSTEKTYTNTFDDLYKTLTVDVSYTDYYGNVKYPSNTASLDVVNSPPEGTVLIHGTRNVGESLYFTHNVVDRDNITVDNPTGVVTFSSYQWYQSDFEDGELTAISEATGSTLLLTPELQAKWIALDATYVDSEGDDDTVHASNRLPVKSTPTGDAIITSADLQLGRQVFLDTSTIADQNDLGEFSYQWYRTEGTGSIAISGAVQTHYSFQPADLGEDIFVTVSYVDGDGDSELLTSNTLGPIVQTSGSVGTVSIDSSSEINGEITSDVENIFAMNNFETVAPVVAYNFHSDTRDVSPNGLHLAGTNFAFDEDGGLDLSHSTSAYLRTSGTTPVLNNDTHTIAFRVKIKNTSSSWTKIFMYGRTNHSDGTPQIWLEPNSTIINVDYFNGSSTSIRNNTALSLDTWHDVIIVKNGSTGRLYVDGNLVDENITLPNPKPTGDYKLEFGWASNTYRASPVIIKDFQIFDFAVDDYTSAANYPFYTEPTLSYQWKADGNPIAGETSPALQLTDGNNDLGKDITLEVSLTDALGNARTVESNTSVVVGSELVQVERFLLEDGSEMLQEDGSSFLSETITDNISLPLSLDGDLIDLNTVLALNGESAEDLSGYRNSPVVVHGNTSISTDEKKFGNSSFFFNGNTYSGVQVPNSDLLDLRNTDWTMEAWIYPDGDYSDHRMIMSKRNYSGTYDYQIWLVQTTGHLAFWNSSTTLNSGVTPPANQWSHVAVVRKDGVVTLYINGEAKASQTLNITNHNNVNLAIGNIGDLNRHPFRGYIDDVRIVKGAALYSENFSVTTSSSIVDQRTVVGSVLSVDVSNVVDPNGLANVEYQWYANNAAIAGATSSSYTITADETNKDIRVKAVFEDGMGRKSARLSDEITVLNTPITGTVQISSTGEYKVGNALLANSVDISDDNGIMSVVPTYQWYRNNSAISGEVGRSYIIKNDDVGEQLHVVASIVDNYYNIETITSDAVSIVDSTGIGSATINGLPKVGSILAIDTSGLSDPNGITSFSYQWRRGVSDLNGETNQTYTVTPTDYGQDITAVVTYVDGAGNITTLSNLPVIHIVRAAALGSVTITGTAEVLSTLTATDTITDQDLMGPKNYQWYLNGSAISGATNSTFEIPRGYEGQDIHVVLSYVETLEDGSNDVETMVSNIVEINSKPYGNVYITGTAKKGQTLYADTSEVVDANTAPISEISMISIGSDVAVFLDAKNPQSYPGSGSIWYDLSENGEHFNVNPSAWNSDGYFAFDGSNGVAKRRKSHSDIDLSGDVTFVVVTRPKNSTSEYRTLVKSKVADHHVIIEWNGWRIGMYDNDGAGFIPTSYSQQSLPGYNSNEFDVMTWRWTDSDNPTYDLNVNGQQKATISNSNARFNRGFYMLGGNGTWSTDVNSADQYWGDIELFIAFNRRLADQEVAEIYEKVINDRSSEGIVGSRQWQREVSNGVFQDISGAISPTYIPVNDDVGKNIRAAISYTDEAGFNEVVYSQPVFVENSLPTGVISFTGTRKTGNTIAATISNISDANGIATIPEYQWKLNGEILVGETGNSYTIIADDVGKELSLQLTYTDSIGIVEVEEQSAGVIEDSETTGQVDITGDFVLNGTVTADISSIADTDGIDTISYQWKALDVEIPGATSQTYVLNDSDMRRFNISVEVSVLDVNGTIKTFSKKKWFDEGAMVATYKWYHFDDLNHILNFQADDQLVTNNLQLHLDANSSNHINGAVWNDLTSNAHNVSIKNDYSSTTGNTEHSTIRMSNGDISANSYRDINRYIDIPEGSVISGKVTVNLDVFEDYYRQYRSRYCSSSSYKYCCGHYVYGYPGPRWHYTCGNYCYVCNSYSYGSWEITNDPGREYNTSQMEFYLVSPSGKEYLIVSGNFSRNSTFEVDADDALAKGQWKIRAKATNSIWNWEDYTNYSNSQGHYYYRRYIDTSISFEYETIDGNSATYSEQGVLGGFDQQQGSFAGLITVEDNKAVKTLEQITLETFVYRESWSQSPNYDEYLAHKDKYELYLDQSNDLTFRVNDSRVNRVNLDRFGLNGWNHIVATYDGVSFKFFINGNLIDATNPINTRQSIDFGDSDDLHIASKGDLFSRWSGKISSFKFYDRAITRKEVLSNYNYELARNGLTEKTFSLQSQDNYLVTNGKVGSYNTSVSTEHTKELRGYFKPLQSGDHTFYVYGADKGYFWVGDKAKERISTSNADIETTSSGEFSFTIYLEADIAYPIRFISGNSHEDNVTSTSRLNVQGPGLSKTTSLQNYLFGGDAAWTYWDTAVAKVTYMVEDFDSQWDDISAYDFTGFSDYQTIISNFGLNVNRTLSESYRWDALPEAEFGDNVETSLEESFEDTSWTGPNRFDWTGVEDPKQVASQFGINGYTSFGDNEERFKWTDAPTATFSGDSLVEETFEDDSWTGFTRVDWTGVDPADYYSGIQGYWEGTHDWTSEPHPEFLQDTFVFSEEFEDTSWTGYTRFDWTGTEDPSSFVSGKGFAAHWEGQFKWSERAQTSFSEKSLLLEESFEEDWTI